MQFGSFHYPDFFTFENALAFCLDCGAERESKPLSGRVVVNTASADWGTPIIEGELLRLCASHHYEVTRRQGEPQHATFRIALGNRILGTTGPVSSMAVEVYFELTDDALAKEFGQKQSELRQAFRRFWGT